MPTHPTEFIPATFSNINQLSLNSHGSPHTYNEASTMNPSPNSNIYNIYSRQELLAVSVKYMTEHGMRYCLSTGLDMNQLTQEELDSISLLDLTLDQFPMLSNEFTPEHPSSLNLFPELYTNPDTHNFGQEVGCSRKDLLAVSVRWLEEDGMHYSLSEGLILDQLTQEELDSIFLLDPALDPALALPDELLPENPGSQDLLLDPRTSPEMWAIALKYRRFFASPEGTRDLTDTELDELALLWQSMPDVDSTATQPEPCTPPNSSLESVTPVPTSEPRDWRMPSTPTPEPLTPPNSSLESVTPVSSSAPRGWRMPSTPTPEPLTPR